MAPAAGCPPGTTRCPRSSDVIAPRYGQPFNSRCCYQLEAAGDRSASEGKIDREKVHGFYVYLHSDPAVRGAQLERRRERTSFEVPVKEGEPEIGDPVIIRVLLTLLHHPAAKTADVVRYLRGHSPPITIAEVRIVFTRYELDSIGKKGGAVGKKLFEKPYRVLGNLLRQHKLQGDLRTLLRELRQYQRSSTFSDRFGPGPVHEDLPALLLWILEGEGKKALLYPFSLPYLEFLQRCQQALRKAECWVPSSRTPATRRAIVYLTRLHHPEVF